MNEHLCEMQCFLEPNCVSYNFHKTKQESGKHKCDLNNATFDHENPGDLKKNKKYIYRGAAVSIKLRGLKMVITTFFLKKSLVSVSDDPFSDTIIIVKKIPWMPCKFTAATSNISAG